MKPSSESFATDRRPSLDFELPVFDGELLPPPPLTLDKLVERNRQLRKWFPDAFRLDEKSLPIKNDVPFEL
jgi:hypothetical protein